MPNDLPDLTRSNVRNWTEHRFFQRGEGYFNQGRIQRARREGRTLKAECQGSRPAAYHVEAHLDDDGIAGAECSCPVGGGGRCKHVVALLLTWIDAPEDFPKMDPLETTLRHHSKDKLIDLVMKMIDRHPDLERLVAVSSQARTELNVDTLRDQIEAVFDDAMSGYGYRYDDSYYLSAAIADDLQPYLNLGDDLVDQSRLADAATVYRLVAEVTCDNYTTFPDEEGDLAVVIQNCTQRLGKILGTTEDADLRDTILRALLDVYLADLDFGGYGIGDDVPDIILDAATDDERQTVAAWVRSALPNGRSSEETRGYNLMSGELLSWDSSSWKREALGGFLLDLEADRLDDEQYLQICRETGRLTDLVDRLLELDRLDEALDHAQNASDYEVVQLTSVFAAHDADDALHAHVRDRLDDDTDRRLVTWLRDHEREHGHLERALELTQRLFWDQQSPNAYETLRAIARDLDRWDEVQTEIHGQLREQGAYALLTRLHLADGDVGDALETVRKAGDGSWRYGGPTLSITVAEAAEEAYPDAAIELYHRRARSLIANRGRDNYAQAATYMKRVKRLFERQDRLDEWDEMLDDLVEDELHRLPAGRDEFQKAGLLHSS